MNEKEKIFQFPKKKKTEVYDLDTKKQHKELIQIKIIRKNLDTLTYKW